MSEISDEIFFNIFNLGYEVGQFASRLSEEDYQKFLKQWRERERKAKFDKNVSLYNLSKESAQILYDYLFGDQTEEKERVTDSLSKQKCWFCKNYEWNGIHEGACVVGFMGYENCEYFRKRSILE